METSKLENKDYCLKHIRKIKRAKIEEFIFNHTKEEIVEKLMEVRCGI